MVGHNLVVSLALGPLTRMTLLTPEETPSSPQLSNAGMAG